MWKYLKIEFDRAFRNKVFFIVILVGCFISVLQIVFEVMPVLQYQEYDNFTSFPHTSYEHYFGLKNGSMFGVYYYLIIPLLAAVPYATSCYRDRKAGYIVNVFTRTASKNYYISKYVVTFLNGGVVAIVPQILNFMIIAALLPSIQPGAGMGFVGIRGDATWAELYYTNSFLYIVLVWIIDFILYGLINTLCITVSWLIENEFLVTLVPFIFVKVLDLIADIIGQLGLAPTICLRPAQSSVSSFPLQMYYLILVAFFLLSAFISIIYGVKRKENI